MNPAWLFILASIIAVLGILTAYKKLIASIQDELDSENLNQTSLNKANTRYFIHLAIIEAIPIVLIIIAFTQIGTVAIGVASRIIGTLFIVGILIFGIVNVLVATSDLNNRESVTGTNRSWFKTLPIIGIGTISSIPIIGLIGLYLG